MVGGLASFVPESFATGLLLVVNTYVAQNFAQGKLDRCGQYARAGVVLALCFCILIFPLFFFADPIFTAFNAAELEKNQAAVRQAQRRWKKPRRRRPASRNRKGAVR